MFMIKYQDVYVHSWTKFSLMFSNNKTAFNFLDREMESKLYICMFILNNKKSH